MAEPSTPLAGTPPVDTTSAPTTPPVDYESRHKEATDKIRILSEEKSKLAEESKKSADQNKQLADEVKKLKSELGIETPPPVVDEQKFVTKDEMVERDVRDALRHHPKISEFKDEVLGHLKNGVALEKAMKYVYADHDITTDESVLKYLEQEEIPSGGSPAHRGDPSPYTPDELKQFAKEGITEEDMKKYGPVAKEILKTKGKEQL